MGFLLDAMSPSKVDGQRDVVKNERRQSYENRPYGMAEIAIDENLYPADHPYHWPTIGSMEDLTAASHQDVVEFYKKFYVPNNASLCIAGDIELGKTHALVEKWFSDVPAGPAVPPPGAPVAFLDHEKRLVLEDKVSLPRLYLVWLSPAMFTPGDAELDLTASILAGGKNSRLYKRLVYDLQIAQDVSAYEASAGLGSSFHIVATARPGHTLTELETVIQDELHKLQAVAPDLREVERAVNQYEASFLRRLEGIAGKADLLNAYFTQTGNPDYFQEDFARYQALEPRDIQTAADTYLRDNNRVVLSVVPQGKKELAATAGKGGN